MAIIDEDSIAELRALAARVAEGVVAVAARADLLPRSTREHLRGNLVQMDDAFSHMLRRIREVSAVHDLVREIHHHSTENQGRAHV